MSKIFTFMFGIFDFFLNLAKMKDNWKSAGHVKKLFYVLTGLVMAGLAIGGTYLSLYLFTGQFSGWAIILSKIGATVVVIISIPIILQAFFGLLFNTFIIFASATKNGERTTGKGYDVFMGVLNLAILVCFVLFEILIFHKFFS